MKRSGDILNLIEASLRSEKNIIILKKIVHLHLYQVSKFSEAEVPAKILALSLFDVPKERHKNLLCFSQ